MTVSNQTARTSAVGSGSIGQQIPFSFPISQSSDLVVKKRVTATGVPSTLQLTTNYTVSINGTSGGTVTTVTAIQTTEEIHIETHPPRTQTLDLTQGGTFNAENVEAALDRIVRQVNDLQNQIDRCVKFPSTDATARNPELPSSIDRASDNLTFDSNGDVAATAAATTTVNFSTFGENLVDDANDITALGTLFNSLTNANRRTWKGNVNLDHAYDVKDFGATGDGTTDDTSACQEAMDTSATDGVAIYLSKGTYLVDEIRVKAGSKGIIGPGTLKGNSSTTEGVVTTNGAYFGGGNIDDIILQDFSIDMNTTGKVGIFASSLRFSTIKNITIWNFETTSSRYGIRLYYGCNRNCVIGNHITLPLDSPYGTVNSVVGIQINAEITDGYGGYITNADGTFTRQTLTNYSNRICDNYIYGGTHNIGIGGSRYNIISENRIQQGTHRGIILSPVADYNIISNNNITEYGSSAIHLGWGSSYNLVIGNKAVSAVCVNGDNGALQAYVGAENNTFVGNYVEGNFEYGVYLAVDADYSVITANTIVCTGTSTSGFHVGIGVETDWKTSPPAGSTYTHSRTWPSGGAAYNGMYDVTIKGNTISFGSTEAQCGIYLAQINSAAYTMQFI
ncbi:MAG: right-handed parallel beta-helix repeat-containing protein, partial [Planctomycetota bacterium]